MSPQPPDQGHDTAAVQDAQDHISFLPRLDARQRAMLAEMGVRVWAPRAAPGAVAPPASVTAPPPSSVIPPISAAAPAVPQPAPARTAPAPAPVNRAPVSAQPPAAPVAPPAVVADQRLPGVDAMDWATLRATVSDCRACSLCEGRTHTVFGAGHEQADWMVVGEAPGEHEDRQGEPYLGEAGRLLDNMLRAVGRSRSGEGDQAAYVAHVLKCRPPTSRNPQPAEVALCAQYLARQVALVQPKVIVAMGPLAVQALLQSPEPVGKLRGRVHQYQGVPVIVTFQPSQLLRTPANKAKAWADLCLALEQLRPAS